MEHVKISLLSEDRMKDKLLHAALLQSKKEAQCLGTFLDFGGNIVLIWVWYSSPFTK